jgi:hypothetical protein
LVKKEQDKVLKTRGRIVLFRGTFAFFEGDIFAGLFNCFSLSGLFLRCRVDEGSQGVVTVILPRCSPQILERNVFLLEVIGHLAVLVVAAIMALTWC